MRLAPKFKNHFLKSPAEVPLAVQEQMSQQQGP
jgi:hypothetical protein